MNVRIKWLRDILKTKNIQGMIVSNPKNVKYLTGLEAEGLLLLTYKENIFLTDSRYTEYANSTLTVDDEIVVDDVKTLIADDYENFFMFCENVGFEENYVSYAQYKKILQKYKVNNLIETEFLIEKQRVVKEEKEIEYIEKACEITDKCFTHILSYIKRGMTEKQIAFEMERFMIENGADERAFETIVASGPNSSKPHAIPTGRKIREGDIILLDFGCKYKGYCSDMSRTIFVKFIDEEIKEAYTFVKNLQEEIVNKVADGVPIKEIAKIFSEKLEENKYEQLHSLGHGVGLNIHERPFLSQTNDEILKNNMIITIEPGVYKKGEFGIRIEDTVKITKNSCIRLTKSEKNDIIIKG